MEKQYESWKKNIETDPYWSVEHAFRIKDIWLYQQYRERIDPIVRRYWDQQWSIDFHSQERCAATP
jgi:hypothetical protein